MNAPIKRILVLGGGSAGFLAAMTLKKRLPALEVKVVRSKELGIIGVGEGSTITLPEHLHDYLQVDLNEFYREADPQWKLGIRFIWGPRPQFFYAFANQFDTRYLSLPKGTGFYAGEGSIDYVGIPSGLMHENRVFVRDPGGAPMIGRDTAYHIENEKFVACLENIATRMGVIIHDDTVVEVLQDDNGITGLRMASGALATADLYIDSSGFFSVLLGKALAEPFVSFKSSLYCERAVVGGWARTTEPIKPYTTAENMNSGWCWQIEHEHRINRGYVYSPEFISDSDAEAEFRAQNPKVEKTRIVRFTSGRYQRAWVRNVIAIGNASGFVEPLEATALGVICSQCQWAAESIADADGVIRPVLRQQYNRRNASAWDQIRRFLAIHYKFNTRLDTPFWHACREKTDLAGAETFVDYYTQMGPSILWRDGILEQKDLFGMEGYLSMMIGQAVPFQRTHIPTAQELETWARIQQAIRNKVADAYTVPEALRIVRSPNWIWPKDIYRCQK